MKTLVKQFICTLVMLVAISGLVMQPAFADVDFVDYYDCSGKPNGNYYHPDDCTKFITCSNGYASERNCAACNPGDPRCPEGRTNFDEPSDACLWPDVARCVSGSSEQSSFLFDPFQTPLLGSMPTTGVVGKHCSL